jgi:hypothetical protein
MSHYKANVRDLEFNLFEVLEFEKALATGEFGDVDGEAVRQMLAEAARLAQARWRNPSPTGTATHQSSTPKATRCGYPNPSRPRCAPGRRRDGRCWVWTRDSVMCLGQE